jgi:hypothetical protein
MKLLLPFYYHHFRFNSFLTVKDKWLIKQELFSIFCCKLVKKKDAKKEVLQEHGQLKLTRIVPIPIAKNSGSVYVTGQFVLKTV